MAPLFELRRNCLPEYYPYDPAAFNGTARGYGRVFLVDMRETDAIFRILAFAVLGAGLLPISYGYFR